MVKAQATALFLAALCWAHGGAAQEALPPEPLAAEPSTRIRRDCATPSQQDVDAAKQAFRDGQTAFSEGNYQQAAELWLWAYEQDCSAHALLLNLATAQELLGRPDLAGATLRQFNERAADSPYLDANRKRIARLERVALAPVRPRRETAAPCPAALPPASPAPEASGGSGISLPWLVAAGGGAAALLGGIFYVEARYSAGQVSDACGGPDECSRLENVLEGERARARAGTAGWIAGLGLVTLTGGLVWQLTSGSPASSSAAGKAPLRLGSSLTPRQLGMTLSGGF